MQRTCKGHKPLGQANPAGQSLGVTTPWEGAATPLCCSAIASLRSQYLPVLNVSSGLGKWEDSYR